jgi:hypothetical protein
MPDDPRFKKSPSLAVPSGIVERQSIRAHRDARRPAQDDSEDVDFEEEISGVYQGEELRALRARRPTAKRLERLEEKHDSLVETVTRVEVSLAKSHGELSGKLDTLVELAGKSAVERERRAAAEAQERERKDHAEAKERERKRKHIVPIIKALGVAIALIAAALIGRGAS